MSDRLDQIQRAIRVCKCEALVVSSLASIRYLTNFSGSNALVLITGDALTILTDRRYRDQVVLEAKNAEPIIAEKDLFAEIKKHDLLKGCRRVAFEAKHLSCHNFTYLRDSSPNVKFCPTKDIVELATIAKTPEEIEQIHVACQIAVKVWNNVLPLIQAGMTELDVAAELSYQAKKCGAEGDAFEPIVASGWRSALPHGTASRKKLEKGELVVIDFGCKYNGFCSDITRTVMLGEANEKQRHIYEAVKQANQIAVDSIEAGMGAARLDGVARRFLKSQGYEKEFSHSLGHGLGLDVHSSPGIAERSKESIPADAVITIEPGVYVPGVGGVRIEDDVLVTPSHPKVLTPIPRELIEIE
mgnify:CR=1 FL=1